MMAPRRACWRPRVWQTELGLPVAMRLVSFAFAGVDPEVMGVGPIPATEKLAKAGLSIDDIGAFEINEAFAVQVLAFCDHFGLAADDPRLNPYGGAIALGHPLASSGATHDSPGARIPGASRRALWTDNAVHWSGHGRHGDLGEPSFLRRGRSEDRRTRKLIADASAMTEGEVVTRALSRDIKLPHQPGLRC